VLIFGSGAVILAGTLSSFFTGRGATRVVMAVDSTAAALNGLLAYLWIFGHAGFSASGIAGAGAATVAAESLQALALAMERGGNDGQLDRCGELLPCAVEEFERFKSTLKGAGWDTPKWRHWFKDYRFKDDKR